MHRPARAALLVLAAALGACAPREPVPLTPPAEVAGAPVVRRPAKPAPLAGIVVPPEAVYVCVVERDGQRAQTVIAFAPRVLALCRKHPEMGPCQYERNVCRAGGGRVYAANGQEITLATEVEYDRKVMRVRFRSN